MKSKLIIENESPLVFQRSIAKLLGMNEAVVLQQMYYWIENNRKAGRHLHHSRYWTYNTYKKWQEQLPFMSVSTIKRTIKSLEKKGILISNKFNKEKRDRTKWYTIDCYYLHEEVKKMECFDKKSDINMTPTITYRYIQGRKINAIWYFF